MKSYRIVHQILFTLAFIPLVLSWGPWYLMMLIPLALVIPYGINELIIERRFGPAEVDDDECDIAHAYVQK